jgi:hypothetical protein
MILEFAAMKGANMKPADIGGAVAILGAGYLIGRDTTNNDFTTTDLFMIAALLVLGWYLAVHLS